MNKTYRNAGTQAVFAWAMACASSQAFALQNARDAIATAAYEKNMRTLSIMQKVDADGDHVVTREELDGYFGKVFDALDRNHDGLLDRKEWVGARREPDVISLSNGGYARALGSLRMMKIVDANADQKVGRREFVDAHQAMYSYMGAGSDGPLDAQHWVLAHFPH
ncbi:MAG: hypothetical protein ABIR62_08540 [Dokdonella sp.]|uniref:hypothetical protein n=1 Tax=Dokdonella sp. TaxID=2291710 RepID=UPI003262DFAB